MNVLRRSIALALLLAAGQAAAQGLPGDAARGRTIAEHWCGECHEVAPGIRDQWEGEPPPFQVIADHPATTELALRAFLQTPHANMPDLQPTPEDTDDLIAYLLTLKGHEPGT